MACPPSLELPLLLRVIGVSGLADVRPDPVDDLVEGPITPDVSEGAGMSVAAHAHTALAADRNKAQDPVWEFRKSEIMEKSINIPSRQRKR